MKKFIYLIMMIFVLSGCANGTKYWVKLKHYDRYDERYSYVWVEPAQQNAKMSNWQEYTENLLKTQGYKVISPTEAEKIYTKCEKLHDKLPDIKKDLALFQKKYDALPQECQYLYMPTNVYWYYTTKDYTSYRSNINAFGDISIRPKHDEGQYFAILHQIFGKNALFLQISGVNDDNFEKNIMKILQDFPLRGSDIEDFVYCDEEKCHF